MRIVTVFSNEFGRFMHVAAGDGTGIVESPAIHVPPLSLKRWFAWMADQRVRHRIGGLDYQIVQLIEFPAAKEAAPHEDPTQVDHGQHWL
jgi:hypothetical protein